MWLSTARVASIRSRSRRFPAWKGEWLMLTTTSAPSRAAARAGPSGYQMSSQTVAATSTPPMTKRGVSTPGWK